MRLSRSRWWRWGLRPVAWLVGVFALTVVGLQVLCHSLDARWLKRRVLACVRTSAGVDVDYCTARVDLLSGAHVEGLVVQSPEEVRPVAQELLSVGRVDAEWSAASLLSRRNPVVERLTVWDVRLTVVVDEHGRTSFDALSSPGSTTASAPKTPLSGQAAKLLRTAPPVGRLDVGSASVALVRTDGGKVSERTELRGLAATLVASPAAPALGGWRMDAYLGSAPRPPRPGAHALASVSRCGSCASRSLDRRRRELERGDRRRRPAHEGPDVRRRLLRRTLASRRREPPLRPGRRQDLGHARPRRGGGRCGDRHGDRGGARHRGPGRGARPRGHRSRPAAPVAPRRRCPAHRRTRTRPLAGGFPGRGAAPVPPDGRIAARRGGAGERGRRHIRRIVPDRRGRSLRARAAHDTARRVKLVPQLPGQTGQPVFARDGKSLYVVQFITDTNRDGIVDAGDNGILFRTSRPEPLRLALTSPRRTCLSRQLPKLEGDAHAKARAAARAALDASWSELQEEKMAQALLGALLHEEYLETPRPRRGPRRPTRTTSSRSSSWGTMPALARRSSVSSVSCTPTSETTASRSGTCSIATSSRTATTRRGWTSSCRRRRRCCTCRARPTRRLPATGRSR